MSTSSLESFGKKAIVMAQELGAQQADLIGARGSSFSLSAQKGNIDKFKVSSSELIGIRIIKDQRVGISYTEALDNEAVETMVKKAVEVSQYSAVDEFQTIDHDGGEYSETNSSLYQEDTASTEEKVALALELEDKVKSGDSRVRNSPYNGYGDGESEMLYLNHLGTSCYHKERSFSCYTTALAEENARQSMYGFSMMGRRFSELNADRCAEEALRHAIPLLDGKSVATGKYDIIFSPDELDQIFGCFLSCFSAKSAKEGKNKFRSKLGEEVADFRISLFDRPKYEDGFYYSAFDDEGMSRQDLCLIQDGVLKSFYHNTNTANYFKTKSTGHASRSPKGGLGVAGTQLVFAPGKDEEKDLHSGQYLKVIGLKGLHSGTDAISGQFSLAIDGILMKGDKVEQYVRDVTISGNFYKLLQQVEGLGRELHGNSSRSFFAPTIRFGGVSVAGGDA